MSLLGAKTRVQALWSLVQDMRLSGGRQRDYKKKKKKKGIQRDCLIDTPWFTWTLHHDTAIRLAMEGGYGNVSAQPLHGKFLSVCYCPANDQ